MRTIYQKLVIYTCLVAVVVVGGFVFYVINRPPPTFRIDTSGGLLFGNPNAKVQIVLFEDFLCVNCQRFMHEVFPELNREYIEKRKASFVIMPVAFLEGSREVTNAAICVYYKDRAQFFPFLKKIMQRAISPQHAEQDLLYLAQLVGNISIKPLEICMDRDIYYPRIKKNYDVAKKLMGENFGTPALFINGAAVSHESFKKISQYIDQQLKEAS